MTLYICVYECESDWKENPHITFAAVTLVIIVIMIIFVKVKNVILANEPKLLHYAYISCAFTIHFRPRLNLTALWSFFICDHILWPMYHICHFFPRVGRKK
jgi:hypothetical protein